MYWFRHLLLIALSVLTVSLAHASSDPDAAAGPKPGRTFEGIEPFHKTDSDEFFICRGTIGDWYRQMNVRDFNKLAARDGLAEVTGSTCALQLIKTHTGKKLPIVSIQMFVSSDAMRNCVLSDTCPQTRQIIV